MKKILIILLSVMLAAAVSAPLCAAQGSVNSNNAMGAPDGSATETVPEGTTYATGSSAAETVASDGMDRGAGTALTIAAIIAGAVLLSVIIYFAVKKFASAGV